MIRTLWFGVRIVQEVVDLLLVDLEGDVAIIPGVPGLLFRFFVFLFSIGSHFEINSLKNKVLLRDNSLRRTWVVK